MPYVYVYNVGLQEPEMGLYEEVSHTTKLKKSTDRKYPPCNAYVDNIALAAMPMKWSKWLFKQSYITRC